MSFLPNAETIREYAEFIQRYGTEPMALYVSPKLYEAIASYSPAGCTEFQIGQVPIIIDRSGVLLADCDYAWGPIPELKFRSDLPDRFPI